MEGVVILGGMTREGLTEKGRLESTSGGGRGLGAECAGEGIAGAKAREVMGCSGADGAGLLDKVKALAFTLSEMRS